MQDQPTLGDRLRELRHARDLTQQELADRTGLSVITISRIEGGKIQPRDVTVRALARALKCSTDDLRDPQEG